MHACTDSCVDGRMQFPPSLCAAAAVCSARESMLLADVWPAELETRTGYTIMDIQGERKKSCSRHVTAYVHRALT